ncbi:hypothetical protein KUTeg_008936 [Tegillarca granosa]|uniref:Uncharacterized protein n=1 Tax=Tegillarca granosa TaxID=220873 RepID=A0ABQ9FAL2_TEGGR|nr:hypothetical protein KUTeg_008936 [Tegillarca granosa]
MKPSVNPENDHVTSRSTNQSQEHGFPVEKKMSLAQSLSKPYITGDLYGKQESRHFMAASDDGELEDMYLEEIIHTGDKMYSLSNSY